MPGPGIALPIISAAAGLGGAAIGATATWLTQTRLQRQQATETNQRWQREVMLNEAAALIAALKRFDDAVVSVAEASDDLENQTFEEAVVEMRSAQRTASTVFYGAVLPLSHRTSAEGSDWFSVTDAVAKALGKTDGRAERMEVISTFRDAMLLAASRTVISAKKDLGFPLESPPRLSQDDMVGSSGA